ncbi:MAG: hypothetical protein IJO09_04235 [Oscillospiraceae bacterium]|nr:hypothetical protein [Oscillospiraceae bacterium]
MERKYRLRAWLLAGIGFLFIIVFLGRLYFLQIVSGTEYVEVSTRRVSKTITIPAPRGEICDRFGRPLVTNRMSFSVVFDKTNWDSDKAEEVISTLINLFDASAEEYVDTLPITTTEPFSYTYNTGIGTKDESAVVRFLREREWRLDMPATEFITALSERYNLKTEDNLLRRKLCGVMYEIETRGFSKHIPYTFAIDVERNLVTKIKENSRKLPGVTIEVAAIREYKTKAAAHILGRIGMIYREEYAELKQKGYQMNDLVGKDGVEKAFESYLRGIDGSRTIETTPGGETTRVLYEEKPILGQDCILTLDLRMQEVAERSLAELVPRLREEGKTNPRWGGEDAKGAACVAIDVKTGGILVMASYPSYDITTYSKDYNTLYNDEYLPLLNRAIGGAYPPGSTFKMITAIEGLESKTITPNEKMLTTGKYMYYAPSTTPMCDIFRQYGKTHGEINVSEALKVSCNYFFYDVGRRVGIGSLAARAEAFGFGKKTGIEIGGEVSGAVASAEAREANGKTWYPGETLSAAIGQSDTLVTPLQLANYTAQLANDGIRYKPHLLKSVQKSDTKEETEVVMPEIVGEMELSEATKNAIREGLHAGAQEEGGTSYSVFENYAVTVAGKTGSAQAPGGSHALYVAYAPVEDPEIAIAIVVENGGQGSRIPSVAKDVFDAYFNTSFQSDSRTNEGVLIK